MLNVEGTWANFHIRLSKLLLKEKVAADALDPE